jgi:hypothetical protein
MRNDLRTINYIYHQHESSAHGRFNSSSGLSIKTAKCPNLPVVG